MNRFYHISLTRIVKNLKFRENATEIGKTAISVDV